MQERQDGAEGSHGGWVLQGTVAQPCCHACSSGRMDCIKLRRVKGQDGRELEVVGKKQLGKRRLMWGG